MEFLFLSFCSCPSYPRPALCLCHPSLQRETPSPGPGDHGSFPSPDGASGEPGPPAHMLRGQWDLAAHPPLGLLCLLCARQPSASAGGDRAAVGLCSGGGRTLHPTALGPRALTGQAGRPAVPDGTGTAQARGLRDVSLCRRGMDPGSGRQLAADRRKAGSSGSHPGPKRRWVFSTSNTAL